MQSVCPAYSGFTLQVGRRLVYLFGYIRSVTHLLVTWSDIGDEHAVRRNDGRNPGSYCMAIQFCLPYAFVFCSAL